MPPIELLVEAGVRLVLPSLLGSAVVLAALLRLLSARWRHVAVAVSLSAGMLLGNVFRSVFEWMPYGAGWPCLLWVAIGAALASAAFLTMLPERISVRGVVLVAIAGGLSLILVPTELRSGQVFLVLGVVTVVNTLLLEAQSRRLRPGVAAAVWAVVLCGGAAAVMIYAHSARFADAATLLACAVSGVAVIAWWKRVDTRTIALPVAAYVPALMLSGYHETFSEVPSTSFVLVALAPLTLVASLLPPSQRLPRAVRFALEILLPLLPVVVAVGLAIRAEGWAVGY